MTTAVLAGVIGLLLIGILLSPFWLGEGGALQAGASINSPEHLMAMKTALLKRYVAEEAAHAKGDLSALAWSKRRDFLTNRYIDVARRLDFLQHSGSQAGATTHG